MNELALFAGAGGGILGGHLLGWRTVCAVERDAYAAAILAQRQNDGILPPFPIWSDVCTFDGTPWTGIIDVVSGGFPCTDISAAGKGAGITGEESGLWKHMARIVADVRPRYVFVENSPMLTARGLGVVLGDLATLGFDAQWGVLGATALGFGHRRERIWILASHPQRGEWGPKQHDGAGRRMGWQQQPFAWDRHWLDVFTTVRRTSDGMADRLDRTDAIRNGQVPRVAAAAFHLLSSRI
ncbi:DNA cytosine methyltransferase [Achromobacter xylosoxidans]|uniref:DNA cytosine methyltransferase n=1 Tax=Achromobacter aegrifaciens TaxID=1287736 RepID=UPI000D46D6AE|nr:DNA cytosine methyltransferase [Achromobacter xylosoxidans]